MTLLLGFSAVNTGNNLLFLVVSGLLAFMSVTGMAGMINLKRLTPELLPPQEVFAGVVAPFTLRIHNAKRHIPSFLIRLECTGGQAVTIPLAPQRGSASATMGLTFFERGKVDNARITISSPFPVNFFTRYWTFDVDTSFVVFPRLLTGVAAADDHGEQRQGSNAHLARGLDGELERISGYSGREPLRMIHWKLSARTDELLVKQFGRQTMQPLVIDLESQPGHTLEERLSTAAWLVKQWVARRPVGLTLDGRTIPAAVGHRHGLHLLTELALYGRD
ncbi:MAG: DUF58 domain-containing protein [Desulfuromonadales bacterium]|nr:DUF58 domain-containing protein [Desulfuromonadales bacterium]